MVPTLQGIPTAIADPSPPPVLHWVYREAPDANNGPSWHNVMPQEAAAGIRVDTAWHEDATAAATVVRLDLSVGPPAGWAGVVVTAAPGNWGGTPGPALDLEGATALAFRARGERGGERIRVKMAITGDAPYGDSAPLPFDSGWITLSADWREYRVPVDGHQLCRVITPFVVIANHQHNPQGHITVLIDDVRFEG